MAHYLVRYHYNIYSCFNYFVYIYLFQIFTFTHSRVKLLMLGHLDNVLQYCFLVERMTCVAKWKEGNKRYFVALVNSKHSQWAEQKDRYQCFLYEDISNQMKMSQGQFSASCQGLWSVLEGSRTFSLQKCKFIV